jgi:hypothetical protein
MTLSAANKARLEALLERESEIVIGIILSSVEKFLDWLRSKAYDLWLIVKDWLRQKWQSFRRQYL